MSTAVSAEHRDAERRAALLGQLRWLVAEAEALEPLLAGLPADVLTMHLPGERSLLATLARLAALDRLALDRLGRMMAEDDAAFAGALEPEGAVRAEASEALGDVRAARQALVEAIENVPPADWSRAATFPDGQRRDLAGFALAVAQRDAAELRRLAYRLHESDLRDLGEGA